LDITLWFELVLFVFLMGFSAFFSSSETSLFSLSKLQREQMRRDENPRLGLIEKLLSEPRRLIVTILIGNEFVNVAASVISAAIVIRLFGAENKLVNLFIMVPILLLVGEITPKTLAIRNNIAFASAQAKPIEWFSRMITPLRWIVRLVSEWFTTLIVGKELNPGSIVTQDMVRTLAREAVGDGVLDTHEARYIEKIFNFGDKTVAEVMTPRSNVLFLPANLPFDQLLQQLKQSKHTKVPLYTGHRDNISGFIHSRDLMGVDLEELQQKPALLQGILREPHFVPETKSASDLFQTFRKRKLSVALVVDEYGGVTGLVSMEDMLECIFGDIPSASDNIGAIDMKRLDDGSTRVFGAMPISQFNQEIGGLPESSEFDTIAGLVLHELGELPVEGTGIVIHDIEFTVDEVDNNRIQTLTVKHHQPDDSANNEVDSQCDNGDESGRDD
jgi:putative hemolysin